MRKPNVQFFVPGFSKCGTTTFCSLLGDHPEIFIPQCKEPNFFAMAYRRGWDWYTDLFEGSDGRMCGEGSTFSLPRTLKISPSTRWQSTTRMRSLSSSLEIHSLESNQAIESTITADTNTASMFRTISNRRSAISQTSSTTQAIGPGSVLTERSSTINRFTFCFSRTCWQTRNLN